MSATEGFIPKPVTLLLRLEGLVALAGAVTAYYVLGGNWWVFALLLLAPDLSMLAALAGPHVASRAYNLAHTYAAPALLALFAWLAGISWLMPVAAVWVAHIGLDRMLGYGLKYPGSFERTHLGLIGKARKVQGLAHTR